MSSSAIHFSQARSEPETMIRCSTVAKMARSTGNSNRRSASNSLDQQPEVYFEGGRPYHAGSYDPSRVCAARIDRTARVIFGSVIPGMTEEDEQAWSMVRDRGETGVNTNTI